MKRQWLHDAAKFGAGLVAADFIMLWWVSMQNVLPNSFLGLPLSDSMIMPGLLVDFFIFLMLVHYGWNIGKIPRMKERAYLTLAGCIFTVVAVAHLARVMYQADIVVLGWTVPIFLSWIGIVAATYLAYSSFHFAARLKR